MLSAAGLKAAAARHTRPGRLLDQKARIQVAINAVQTTCWLTSFFKERYNATCNKHQYYQTTSNPEEIDCCSSF
jgi:hypothetical protein